MTKGDMSTINYRNKAQQSNRNAELAMIHIAKKQLCLDDDSYRAMLFSIAQVKSSKDLDFAGRQRVLSHLKKLGFQSTKKYVSLIQAQANVSIQDVDMQLDDQSRKICALWADLYNVGKVKNPSYNALCRWVKRNTGVDAPQFLTSAQKSRAIESLKKWFDRPATKTD